MRYPIKCPRCGGKVVRHDLENAFPLGTFLKNAFGAHVCEKCGKIPDTEFSAELRRVILKDRALFVALPFILLAIILFVLSRMN